MGGYPHHVYPFVVYTFTASTPYLGPEAPTGTGPDSPPTVRFGLAACLCYGVMHRQAVEATYNHGHSYSTTMMDSEHLSVTTNFHISAQGPPRAPGPPPPLPECVTIGQLSNGECAVREYTFTTNFHIWAQGPPGAPGPTPPLHNVLRLGS